VDEKENMIEDAVTYEELDSVCLLCVKFVTEQTQCVQCGISRLKDKHRGME